MKTTGSCAGENDLPKRTRRKKEKGRESKSWGKSGPFSQQSRWRFCVFTKPVYDDV